MYKGKAIYNPSGKAGEYSYWACNFYVGCSNGCTYCYLKKGRGAKILGGDKPTLKKCFKDEIHAFEVFEKELRKNINDLKKHGLFFSFTTDPMIEETYGLTVQAVKLCNSLDIPVKILTKEVGHIYQISYWIPNIKPELIAIGFTLTGHDELEPNVSPNEWRVSAFEYCKQLGYKTFASIEPIIDIKSSCEIIDKTKDVCDLYKVGLLSGAKYNSFELLQMVNYLAVIKPKVYIKESIRKLLGDHIEPSDNFVERDYNIFGETKKSK